jgi:hypothetical protein
MGTQTGIPEVSLITQDSSSITLTDYFRYDVPLKILLHVHPLLGNVLVNRFPRRQILSKQCVARLRNNRGGCVFYVVRSKQQ